MLLVACPSCHRQYDVEGMAHGEQVRCRCGALVQVPRTPPREARMLHCSSCGGKLRLNALRCEYCSSTVMPADRNLGPACPECFARLPAGAGFCSDCGLAIRPEAMRTSRVSAGCPRCAGQLVLRELPRGHYTECTSCGGIWLDDKSFDRVIEEKDSAALGELVPLRGSERVIPVAPDTVKYLPCPTCGNLMHRRNFGAQSGVIIDWCKGHGFWFDCYELEKVISFIKSGGLDRARKMEIERSRAELERIKIQKAATAAAVGRGLGRTSHAGADWFSSLGGLARLVTDLLT